MFEMVNIKRAVLLTLLLSICLLSGCGVKEKPEKEVVADLQTSKWFISENLEIKSYEITKRQTDVENKKDIVYVTVHTNEPEMKCDLSYVMEYVLYNDGWVLEAVNRDYDGVWNVAGLTADRVAADVIKKDEFYDQWDLRITNCEIKEETDFYDGERYGKRVHVRVAAEQKALCSEAEYIVEYLITDDGWQENGFSPNEPRDYWPTSGPSADVAESVVKTLKTDDSLVKVSYDSHKYKETDNSNLKSRMATIYYTAQKKWTYCTETYLIAIPCYFSLDDEGMVWTCKAGAVRSELYSVDFNIQGTRWTCNYNDYGNWSHAGNGYSVVDLKVGNITSTQDPAIYSVQVQCDAKSRYFKGEDEKYNSCCKTDSQVQAKLKWEGPGCYCIYIDKQGDYLNWSGTFKFDSSSSRDAARGVFWRGNVELKKA